MEAGKIIKIIDYVLHRHCFIIEIIIGSDNITMKFVIKYTKIGAQVQVMNSSKVKLYEEIPPPSLIVDPSHQFKIC